MGPSFVRRNVWTLPSGDRTVEEYAKAVAIMQSRPASDPTSWIYQAAMHGSHDAHPRALWNGCQHGTWFFLPWHRMFLYYFERIVRAAVVQAGGSAQWALPYWDYGAGGRQATLPVPFRSATAGGGPNPLHVSQRATGINTGLALPPAVTSPAHALGRTKFTGVAQFGGGITRVQQFSNSTGQVEQTPHNDVHVVVGGQSGWMADPDRAAADPIFWVHHANIDRLWHLWTGTPHTDPTDHRWTGQKFSFFDEHGNQVQMTPADVRDIAGQLGYTYETAPVAAIVSAPTPAPAEEPTPELVGASDTAVTLTGGVAEVSFEIDARAAASALHGAAEPAHVFLSAENIEGDRNPGTVYGMYVNLPDGASAAVAEAHHAGNLSFFGLERARNPRGDEQAHSLEVTRTITHLVQRLAGEGSWDGRHVSVTFRPLGLIPHDRPERGHALPEAMSDSEPPVTVGRVSIRYA
jgi:tyrosinase